MLAIALLLFLFAVTRERVADTTARGGSPLTGFYSLLRESGSLTSATATAAASASASFLFAVTRERVTDSSSCFSRS